MREDLRKIIEDNWADIQELIIEKVEAEQKPKSIWDLKKEDSEQYYVLRTTGDINIDYFSSRLDEYIREVGNVFLTREDAEFEQERRKIETIMKKYSRPFTKNKRNYYIYYDCAFLFDLAYSLLENMEDYRLHNQMMMVYNILSHSSHHHFLPLYS